jgi:hypothetical protein
MAWLIPSSSIGDEFNDVLKDVLLNLTNTRSFGKYFNIFVKH